MWASDHDCAPDCAGAGPVLLKPPNFLVRKNLGRGTEATAAVGASVPRNHYAAYFAPGGRPAALVFSPLW